MFFNPLNETILKEIDASGNPVYRYVLGDEKLHAARKLNSQINEDQNANSRYIRHANSKVNTIEEVLNRAPMYCNFLQGKGYKNILFVGHFNAGQTDWLLSDFADRAIDLLPPEREHLGYHVDPNIMLQFIPMIHTMWKYQASSSIVKPPESKHTAIMHSLYNINGLSDKFRPSNSQYRHAYPDWRLQMEDHEAKYDAVVFLGCPKEEDNGSFTEAEVRERFNQYCTNDFDIVDMYYNAGDAQKFVGSVKESNVESLARVFANRSQWDDEVQETGGRPEEVNIMDRTISVYKG